MPQTSPGAAHAASANPLLADTLLPAFDRIRPEHVEPALRELLAANRRAIAAIEACAEPTFAVVVEPLEAMRHRLGRAWSPVGHLNGVANSEALRAAYNACLPLLSEYYTDLAQSEPLYRAYQAIREREGASLAPEQLAVLERALRDFRLSGVALEPVKKARFKAVMVELSQLQSRFEEHVLDATNGWSHPVTDGAQLRGVNPALIDAAAARARDQGLEGWLFGLDQPTYVAILTDGESRELRRAFYEAWSTRASDQGPHAGNWDNTPLIEQVMRLRHEAARLLGFANFADYALADRMAHTVPEVTSFLRELAGAARASAQAEFAELEAFAGHALEAWDVMYYSERLQEQRFRVSQEELREYLPLPRVLAGLFEVAERLYDVRIRERAGVALWHADARYYDVCAADGRALAGFYLDATARPNKRSGAWMDDCIGRREFGGQQVLPVAYLVCNSLPAHDGKPAQLTHDDVVTLFHEFGHGLHHMLTRVGYPSIAGINGVAWDAVELPSQFMENYAWLPEVLERISSHATSGTPIPADKQRQLIATRSFQAGLQTLRQVEFALLDMRLHSEYVPERGARLYELLAEVRAEVAVTRIPPWNRYLHSFTHIFSGGYAAGYYSYKWAEVLAADAFAAFTETGPFDRGTAGRFLGSILSRGGSRDPLEAFIEFRGRKPDIGPLLALHGIGAR